MALTRIKTSGLTDNSVTDAKVADAITVTGAQTGITQVGTLTALSVDGDIALLSANDKISDGTNNILERTAGGYITIGASAWNEIRLNTTGSTDFVLDNSGQVGIGTASPSSYNSNTNNLVVRDSGSGGITISTGASNTGYLAFNDGEDTTIEGLIAYNQSNDTMSFRTAGTDNRLVIDGSGNVGVNETNPAAKFDIDGDIQIRNANALLLNHTGGGASDTYINSPSSNVMAFRTGGSERMRIDSNGHIRFGSSGDGFDSAWADSTYGNTEVAIDGGGGYGVLHFRGDGAGSTNTRYAIGVGDDKFYLAYDDVDARHNIVVDGSGNVGINETNPQSKLHISDTASTGVMLSDTNAGTNVKNYEMYSDSGLLGFRRLTDAYSGYSPTMVITSGGNTLFNCTSFPSASVSGFGITGTSSGNASSSGSSTSAWNHLLFYNGNGIVGSISSSGSTTTYSTSSDYRLKENEVVISDGLTRLNQLKPYRFNFIADADTTVDGFFAHEVAEVVPEAITGEKDAVDDDGNIVSQSIDQSKLVPLLVKAVQELSAKVEALENA